jgi:hypothetical protein
VGVAIGEPEFTRGWLIHIFHGHHQVQGSTEINIQLLHLLYLPISLCSTEFIEKL